MFYTGQYIKNCGLFEEVTQNEVMVKHNGCHFPNRYLMGKGTRRLQTE